MNKNPIAIEQNLEDPHFFLDPAHHKLFAELRQTSPVSWRSLSEETRGWNLFKDQTGYWVVVRHKDIVAVCTDPATYCSSQGAFLTDDDQTIGALVTTDPPRHNDMRKSVVKFFNNKAIRDLEDWLREECKSLIQNAIDTGEVEFVYDVAVNLPLAAIGQIMELPIEQRDEMFRLSDGLVKSSKISSEEAQKAAMSLAGFAINMATVRRAKEGTDLISQMLTIGGKEQTDAEFVAMFAQLAIASTETTRSVLAHIITEFARKPELMRQLADPECNLDLAVNEFLRFYPPVNSVLRTATRDHELAGVSIKKGDRLALMYASGNFDEDVFDAPHEFDITRKPNPHLTFGVGQHHCLGFRLAQMELRVFLEQFLKMVTKVELMAEPVLDAGVAMKVIERAIVKIEGK